MPKCRTLKCQNAEMGSKDKSRFTTSRFSTQSSPARYHRNCRIAEPRNAKMPKFHFKGESTALVASHPIVATPPEILNTKRHSALTFSQICEIQQSMGFWHFFHEEVSLLVHSSSMISGQNDLASFHLNLTSAR
jgi:hypothetical protein